jgi:hypothetical protein
MDVACFAQTNLPFAIGVSVAKKPPQVFRYIK